MTSYEEMMVSAFTEWLEDNGLDYQMKRVRASFDNRKEYLEIYVNFPNGSYIRVSEFDYPHSLYVRDTGIIERMSAFELTQRILEEKGEN